jgi:hypothetical protein
MRNARLCLAAATVAAGAILAAACAPTAVEQPAPAAGAGATPVVQETTTVSTTTTVTTTTTSGAPGQLQLGSVNNSGFTGNVTLTHLGEDDTRVTLVLVAPANVDADADHDAAIQTGSCEAPGMQVAELMDVEGNGKASETTVDLTPARLMDGGHIVVVEESPGDRPVACVAIPRAN